eukprot:1159205-Pelagomonas_calceolata.AAC.1
MRLLLNIISQLLSIAGNNSMHQAAGARIFNTFIAVLQFHPLIYQIELFGIRTAVPYDVQEKYEIPLLLSAGPITNLFLIGDHKQLPCFSRIPKEEQKRNLHNHSRWVRNRKGTISAGGSGAVEEPPEPQQDYKTCTKLHTHSAHYAYKNTTMRRAVKCPCSFEAIGSLLQRMVDCGVEVPMLVTQYRMAEQREHNC